ncbi:A/G-specific adenine glycosylase [Microbacterium amylolyticum]|uniref:Adenine DNA glycosylase n=1 Tax=Microbacterium amylolyticum TaxID=936337 RepID=A0ABS4ZFZ5_9MICO|nr:A/G-specific adenine glycosylase [Microbacterium amylolyticum]MBP2436192.1 A/G-specific adenine glycosylase [Microbacterium amylolyticum]
MPAHSLADALVPWYRRSARDLPWRHENFSAWGTLVSEFMLQQTPVARVIPLLETWLKRWPTPTDLADAPAAEAVTHWANLGYPRRALWLHRAAVQIRDHHGGVVPRDVDDLLALTGIGDYTARAVAVFAYGDRHPVVDTNTRRVLARALNGTAHPGPAHRRDLEQMEAELPESAAEAALMNAAAMELGQVVCTARSPRCGECPVRDMCAWVAAGSPATPDTRKKQAAYEGSDRQARGRVLRALRDAAPEPVPHDAILIDWPDAGQRDRAFLSLLADGLIESDGDVFFLPR